MTDRASTTATRRDAVTDAEPLLRGTPSHAALDRMLLDPIRRAPRGWRILLAVTGAGTLLFVALFVYSVGAGVGVWGNNVPVGWGFPIINFVWWIGIGHAGTFISAFLLLMAQRWRSSINRIAEAMTVFALVNAGLFPILHLGRQWFFHWLVPYPSNLAVWPQFRSTLPWDVAAITTYFAVSLMFWYVGMLPDLAAARDAAFSKRRRIAYGVLALGWHGSGRQWRHHRALALLLAGLATPLVISVHTIVSLDFAIAQLPGWHSTIFPPYFVVGAIHSGLALVLLLLVPIRRVFSLRDVITERHLENIALLLLAAAWMLLYAYAIETFMAWYSGDPYERYTYLSYRPGGTYAPLYWIMIVANTVVPQLFWSRRLRRNELVLAAAGAIVLAGMWLERFTIIVTSQARDFLPSSWNAYFPTWVDWGLLLGSISLFAFLMLLFLRWAPFIPISEMQRLRHELTERA